MVKMPVWAQFDEYMARAVQRAGGREAEQLKAAAAVLKRLCRQRTAVAWKEWRASVEADYASALQVHVYTKLFLLCTVKQTFMQCY